MTLQPIFYGMHFDDGVAACMRRAAARRALDQQMAKI